MTRARDLADIADKDISGTLVIDDLTASGDVTIAGDLSVTGSTTGISSGNLSAVLTSGNTTGGNNIVFGDSSGASDDRLVFGAGSDLQIYHDGNSKIADVGDGKLELQSDGTGVFIQKGATEYMGKFEVDGAVTLYYDNSPTLATTSTGVDVKNVASGANAKLNITTESTGGGTSEILFSDNTTGRGRIYYDHGSSPEELHIETTGTDALVIDNSQNVSIPNGNVGIGGSPVSYANAQVVLYIEDDTSPAIAISDTGQAKDWYMVAQGTGLHFNYADGSNTGSASNVINTLQLSHGGDGAIFNDGGENRDFRVESDGNANMLFVDANENSVSVGTSSTSVSALNVFSSGANTAAIAARGNGSANGMVLLGDLYTDDENQITLGVGYANANAVLARGCKPSSSSTNAFVSSQDTYNNRPAALTVQDGSLKFYTTTVNTTTTTNSAVTLYNYFDVAQGQTVFNEDGLDQNFRVETDASNEGFVVNAGNGYLSARGASQVRFTLGSTGTSGGNTANWIRGNGSDIGLNAASGNIHFEIGGTERMRIQGSIITNTGSGNLPSASLQGFGVQDQTIFTSANSTGTRNHHLFYNGNGQVGSINTSGSGTSFNTSSDYRLKENVVYDWDATTRLKQLKPARFNFIADADTTVDGFLAHEAQTVVPEAVTGTHNEVDSDGNAVMQGIDQSKLVPLLVKTIQELEARITALENA